MIRRYEKRRLAYYRCRASEAFWDEHWQASLSDSYYRDAELGHFGPYEGVFTRHLPKDGRIVEAGCGLGQVVLALRCRGYNAEGIEFAPRTVDEVKRRYPELPISQGDVCHIDCPDGTYDAYISLGVIEHRQAGPEPFLTEARRVLTHGGKALVSVPFLNPLRMIKARLGFYRRSPRGAEFYQCAFSKAEIRNIINGNGFKVVEAILYDGAKGVSDEIGLLRLAFRIPVVGARLKAWLAGCQWLENHFGHMILCVCEKAEAGGDRERS